MERGAGGGAVLSSQRLDRLLLEVEPGQLVVAELGVERAQAVVELLDGGRADQRVQLERLVEHPGQRDLLERAALLLRQLLGTAVALPVGLREVGSDDVLLVPRLAGHAGRVAATEEAARL